MPTGLFLDSNVWNFLFDRKLGLSVELPKEEFTLVITREAEIEFPPDGELKRFVEETIRKCDIRTDSYFGFGHPDYPDDKQRAGGFGFSRFISSRESAFIQNQAKKKRDGADRPNGLHKNEADISLAARSFASIVVTSDKNGPIKDALKEGGKVIFLSDFDKCGLTLRHFILHQIDAIKNLSEYPG